jgi:phage/plasmid-associated DNA primase
VQTTTTGSDEPVLFWWDERGLIWNEVRAQQQMLRLIGNELFFGLQRLALTSIKCEKYKALVLRGLVQLQNRSFKEKVMKDVLTAMEIQSIEFDVNPEQHDNLHFRNGVLMLNRVSTVGDGTIDTSAAFRPRERTDYVTKTLDWDFGPAETNVVSEVEAIFAQIQPLPEQRCLQLGFLAYALTGHTDAQTFKINVGYSASNGKSTECEIHEACFGLYTSKLHKSTFSAGNQKSHKFLIGLLCNPVRYAYIEELDRSKLDADMLKDFVSGGKITVEVMYGTDYTTNAGQNRDKL